MLERIDIYLEKAAESLEGAESEFTNRRYNNAANRCYYAAFQAAISALTQAGILPREPRGNWGHEFVQAEFVGQLINRRKVYPAALRQTLAENYALRETADYTQDQVTELKAARAIRRTTEFVGAVLTSRRRP